MRFASNGMASSSMPAMRPSFITCIHSIALMGTSKASLAFDGDFSAAGFVELRP